MYVYMRKAWAGVLIYLFKKSHVHKIGRVEITWMRKSVGKKWFNEEYIIPSAVDGALVLCVT